MLVHLVLALAVMVFIIYTFVYSPLAVRIADKLFYDPLEDTVRRDEARMARWDEARMARGDEE